MGKKETFSQMQTTAETQTIRIQMGDFIFTMYEMHYDKLTSYGKFQVPI